VVAFGLCLAASFVLRLLFFFRWAPVGGVIPASASTICGVTTFCRAITVVSGRGLLERHSRQMARREVLVLGAGVTVVLLTVRSEGVIVPGYSPPCCLKVDYENEEGSRFFVDRFGCYVSC